MTNQDTAHGADDLVLGEETDGAVEAPVMERREASDDNGLRRAIFDVPIDVIVSVGRARPLIGDLLALRRNHLLPLDARIEDPVELIVKGRVIAKGELTQIPGEEGQLGIKLTEIVSLANVAE